MIHTLLRLAICHTTIYSPTIRRISAFIELDIASPLRGGRKVDKGVAVDEEGAGVVAGEGDGKGGRPEITGEGLEVVCCLAGVEVDVAGGGEGEEEREGEDERFHVGLVVIEWWWWKRVRMAGWVKCMYKKLNSNEWKSTRL